MISERKHDRPVIVGVLVVLLVFAESIATRADDGYRLWLRYDKLPDGAIKQLQTRITSIVVSGESPTSGAIRSELTEAFAGLMATTPPSVKTVTKNGALVVGTPATSTLIAGLKWNQQLSDLGPEGYMTRTT